MILRPALITDADALLDWRNDAHTRTASRNHGLVGREGHIRWLDGVLHDPDSRLFIAEQDGIPVGTVRADRKADGMTEISWTVSPRFRNRGIARAMLDELFPILSGMVCAEIKANNIASIKVAAHAGMLLVSEIGGVLRYQRDLGPSAS